MRWRRVRGVVCAAALAGAVGCAGADRARGAQGGAPWRELASEHFVLRTDISSDSARRLIADLELQRALLLQAMPALEGVRGRLEVDALSSREEYWAATGQRADYVGHAELDEFGRARMVLFVSPSGDVEAHASIVAHELAHGLSWHVVPAQPRWFCEGLAGFLESVALERGGKRWVGLRANHWEEIDPLPVRELLAWTKEAQNREWRFYQSAWALVRYLDAEQPAGFAELQRRLAAGDGGDAAWNGAFPRWSLDTPGATADLDRILRARANDKAGTRQVSAAVTVEPSERLLSAAQEHTVRLSIRLRWTAEALERLTGAALAIDPGHVQALSMRAQSTAHRAQALALARRAVTAHPEDPRAWSFLGWALAADRGAEREAAFRRAVELSPEVAEALALLADEVGLERPEEAVDLATRARDRAPWSGYLRVVRAIALSRHSRCDEARAEVRFARSQLGPDIETWASRLGAAEERCGAPAARAERLSHDAGEAITQGRITAALRLADAAVAVVPDHALAWNERGRALDRTGRLAEAEEAYRRAVRTDPKHVWAWRNLGLVLQRLGRAAEAVEMCRRQVEVTPDQAMAHRELGLVLLQANRAAEALAPLERAAALDAKDPSTPLALGRVQLALRKPRLAADAFERALSLRRDPYALNEAAYYLADASAELDRAAAWAEAAVKARTEQLVASREGSTAEGAAAITQALGSAWDTLGWVRFRQGRLDDAERWIRAAEHLRPNAEISAHLGAVLEKAGRSEEAIAPYARAATRDANGSARARLDALAGARAAGALSRARAELDAWRTLPASAGGPVDAGPELELLLAGGGAVSEARTRGGSALPAVAEALRAARHEIPFPDPSVPFLVVKATWRCAAGACAAVLEDESGL